jgi:hypothetical protein
VSNEAWVYTAVAFLHALFVIVGVYVAFNVRINRLEDRVATIWDWWTHKIKGGRE